MGKQKHLQSSWSGYMVEAGCDEAGRGCLAGPVFAAAVVLPPVFSCPDLNDSKQLSAVKRNELREFIETNASAWAVESVDNKMIDRVNILQASYQAMHKAISKLSQVPQILLIDGNRFVPYTGIPHECFVKGDARFMAIAAASVLAKTHRDEYMVMLHNEFPEYGWNKNKGYPTPEHIEALRVYGPTPYHRLSFRIRNQLKFQF